MKLAHWGPYALVESLSFDGILVETWNGPWAVCAAEETPPSGADWCIWLGSCLDFEAVGAYMRLMRSSRVMLALIGIEIPGLLWSLIISPVLHCRRLAVMPTWVSVQNGRLPLPTRLVLTRVSRLKLLMIPGYFLGLC